MFIKSGVRTLLIWAGLILCWLLAQGLIGYGEPYEVVSGGWIYTYQDRLGYGWLLYALAFAMIMTGCYIWTRLKNRHWVYMLWGILTPIGLLGISLLKDKSQAEAGNRDDSV